MTIVTLLCGIPASGKSTYYERLLDSFDDGGFYREDNEYRYSTDYELEQIAAEQGISYRDAFTEENNKLAADRANAKLNVAICNGDAVVWDQTNVGSRKRSQALVKFPTSYYRFGIVFLPPGCDGEIEILKERFYGRKDKEIPWSVMVSMMERFEMPTISEGFDDLVYVNPYNYFETIYDVKEISRRFLETRDYVARWKKKNDPLNFSDQ